MKALVKYANGKKCCKLKEVPRPVTGPQDALIEVKACGICGTDVHTYYDPLFLLRVPVVLGHEFSGVVTEIGRDVNQYREGDRVVAETSAYVCNNCVYCNRGDYNLCRHRLGLGYGADGAIAEYVKVPARALHKIPQSLSFEKAALVEPACVAYHALIDNSTIGKGDLAVVIGPGTIGLLCVQILKRIQNVDTVVLMGKRKHIERLELARRLGANAVIGGDSRNHREKIMSFCDGQGAHLVVDAVGSAETLRCAMEIVRPKGQITKIGWGNGPLDFSIDSVIVKEIRLQGSFSHTPRCWAPVIDMIAKGIIDVTPFVKETYDITKWRSAFSKMKSGTIIKAIIVPSEAKRT